MSLGTQYCTLPLMLYPGGLLSSDSISMFVESPWKRSKREAYMERPRMLYKGGHILSLAISNICGAHL